MAIDPHMLNQFKLYRGLGSETMQALALIAVIKKVRKGQRLWRYGDKPDGYYSIMSGLAKSFRETADGREQVLCLTGPGQQIGTMAVLGDGLYPCSASVLEAGEFLYFPRAAFKETVRQCHDLALQLLSGLGSQCNVLANRVEDLSLHDADTRLRSYLLSWPVKGTDDGGVPVVILPVSKTTLANILGLSRETLSRTFASLQHQRLIDIDGRRITLLDSAGLETLDTHIVETVSTL